jgi:lipoprotein-anchoring transpeptidase ErfK/SrfK
MSRARQSWVTVVVCAVLTPLSLAACGDDKSPTPPAWQAGASAAPSPLGAPSTGASDPATSPNTTPGTFAVTPATGKKDVPISAEITAKVDGGKLTAVALREAGGSAVAGELRGDGSAWVPAKPLKNNKGYEATVTATNGAGQAQTVTTSFTTMDKPSKRTGTGLYMFDGATYGVAMPVVVEFSPGIKKADRADVQRRMFVKTDPPQPGTWYWVSSGSQAYYRAPEYWKPGTTVAVRIGVGGHPTGGGRYGDQDRTATAKIGRSLIMNVDNKTKKMVVTESGKVIKTMPVSLGKPSTPSASGTMVVMEKKEKTVFDTFAELGPKKGYKVDIEYAQRLTWSGQYIHSAPWSVDDQGHRNVSHGCVNVAPGNAKWLFDKTLIGDPIVVKGTGEALAAGNGWTAWDMSWAEFAKGSALPVPSDLGAGN